MSRFLLSLVCLSALVGCVFSAMAPPEGLNQVYVQLQYNQISKVDGVEQAFASDFYMTTYWSAPKANVNDSTATDLTNEYLVASYWNPGLEFINARDDGSTKLVDEPYSFVDCPVFAECDKTPADHIWILCDQRYTGAFTTPLDMHAFPFDKQDAVLQVESFWDNTQVQINFAQPEKIAEVIPPSMPDIVGWRTDDAFFHKSVQLYQYNQRSYDRLTMGVTVAREPQYFLAKIVCGVLLLVYLCIWVFTLQVDEVDRMMGTLQIFSGLVAFLFVLGEDVPKVPYLTRLDSFMMLSFFVVSACSFIHGALYFWREDRIKEEAEELDAEREALHKEREQLEAAFAPHKPAHTVSSEDGGAITFHIQPQSGVPSASSGQVSLEMQSTAGVQSSATAPRRGSKVADASVATLPVWRIGHPENRPSFSMSAWWRGLAYTRKWDVFFMIILTLTISVGTAAILGRPESRH